MPKKRNPNKSASFAEIDSEREKLPSSAVSLTAQERRLLKDPSWIDEDEAEAIIGMRISRDEAHTAIPLREYMRRRGREVEG